MKFSHDRKTTRLEEKRKRLKTVNILSLQRKALLLSGILPSLHVSSNAVKSKFYDLYTGLTLFSLIPAVAAHVIELYNHLDDIQTSTAVLFQLSTSLSTGITTTYFVYNRKRLLFLLRTLEEGFVFHMRRVGTTAKQAIILEKAQRKSLLISRILSGIGCSAAIAWTVVPFVAGYKERFFETDHEVTEKDARKYFGLAMWLPQNVVRFPTYELTHFFHAFVIYTTIARMCGCYLLIFNFIFHTSTQFVILVSAINTIDDIPKIKVMEKNAERKCSPNLNNSVHDRQVNNTYFSISRNRLDTVNEENSNYFRCQLDPKVEQESENVSVETTGRIKKDGWNNVTSFQSIHQITTKTESRGTFMNKYFCHYLRDCIRYHQDLCRFCSDMSKFFSPVLLIFFVVSEATMCLSAFLLTLDSSEETNLKYFFSMIFAFMWPLLICWCGDTLAEKSVEVGQAAYLCRWHDRSSECKTLLRIVIMRAQKPVHVSAGNIYVVSLKTFTHVANKVYSYYTVLKQLNST